MRFLSAWLSVVVVLGQASAALAGPVILGGDDLGDHGSFNGGTMLNEGGWLYIEKAVDNILDPSTNITRPGNDGSIAALGSSASMETSGDPGAGIGSAADALGKTINFYNGAAAINQFFTDLASGSVNPAMLWISGEEDDEANTLDAAEAAALVANANAIAAFVNSGGGLMGHGCDSSDDTCQKGAYGWLSALLPGLVVAAGCENEGAMLTAAGQAAFPGLSDSNIDDTPGGDCHNHFTGNLGSLKVLAVDGEGRTLLFGGGPGTVIQSNASVPAINGWLLAAMGALLALAGGKLLRR